MVEMFGERSSVCSVEEFFGCISRFIEAFEEARLAVTSQKVRRKRRIEELEREGNENETEMNGKTRKEKEEEKESKLSTLNLFTSY